MVSDRPSAWLLGLLSHLVNSMLLVLLWAMLIVPNLPSARSPREPCAALLRASRLYWVDDAGFYAFALDGQKRRVVGISSNPGHLLWCGLPDSQRAGKVAKRLLQPDMFSGWGLRTLSSSNPAYNPLSYQRGSVWPHDTMLAAAGLWRYDYHEEACTLVRALLEAAGAFEEARLPELFCGLPRSHDLPVPYAQANIPQAWAAAAPILVAQLFLGLLPDAPQGRCFVSPWLPEWLSRLELRGIAIGQGTLDITVIRRGTATVFEYLESKEIEVMESNDILPIGYKKQGAEARIDNTVCCARHQNLPIPGLIWGQRDRTDRHSAR